MAGGEVNILGSLTLATGTTSLVPTPLVMVKYLLGIQLLLEVKLAVGFRRKVGALKELLLLTGGIAAANKRGADAAGTIGMREVRGCTRSGPR